MGVGSDSVLGLLKMPRPLMFIQCFPVDEKHHPLSEQKAMDRKLSQFEANEEAGLHLCGG